MLADVTRAFLSSPFSKEGTAGCGFCKETPRVLPRECSPQLAFAYFMYRAGQHRTAPGMLHDRGAMRPGVADEGESEALQGAGECEHTLLQPASAHASLRAQRPHGL